MQSNLCIDIVDHHTTFKHVNIIDCQMNKEGA